MDLREVDQMCGAFVVSCAECRERLVEQTDERVVGCGKFWSATLVEQERIDAERQIGVESRDYKVDLPLVKRKPEGCREPTRQRISSPESA